VLLHVPSSLGVVAKLPAFNSHINEELMCPIVANHMTRMSMIHLQRHDIYLALLMSKHHLKTDTISSQSRPHRTRSPQPYPIGYGRAYQRNILWAF
jgi:hypothetical protein